MKHIRATTFLILGMLVMAASPGQVTESARSPFDELLEATRFIQNYKETAEVSAKVFGARAQGSDKDYAAFMAKVAKADLSDLQSCLSKAYAKGPLTADDARELVQFFRSPIGIRLIELSQKMQLESIKAGAVRPLDPSLISETERQELARAYQKPAFARYNAYMASQENAMSTRVCVASSKVGRESGIRF